MTSIRFRHQSLQRPGPTLNAWGQSCKEDELARLNLITPQVVIEGLAAVKPGLVIHLETNPASRGVR